MNMKTLNKTTLLDLYLYSNSPLIVVMVMMFNATFNNISVISWLSVLWGRPFCNEKKNGLIRGMASLRE
jgi:hypothetical protein